MGESRQSIWQLNILETVSSSPETLRSARTRHVLFVRKRSVLKQTSEVRLGCAATSSRHLWWFLAIIQIASSCKFFGKDGWMRGRLFGSTTLRIGTLRIKSRML